jgi:pimeloyl-ACP methyl ester carboxylesterase
MGAHTDVLVAQSLGGFLAPVVGARARMIVLLNAMIPLPGEKIGDWWAATDSGAARRAADLAAGRDPDFDLDRHFLHDLPPDTRAELLASPAREPADTVWSEVCDFERWPDVPIKVLVGRDDRFFPAGFQRRVARERLGLDVDELAGGHLVALSNPLGLADRLVAYAGELPASS